MSTTTTSTSRSGSRRTTKWHHAAPPPPPSPKVLQFPRSRRTRRKKPKSTTRRSSTNSTNLHTLLAMLHQDSSCLPTKHKLLRQCNDHQFSPTKVALQLGMITNSRTFEDDDEEERGGYCEEMLIRAECDLLRMDRELLAQEKLERNRVKMHSNTGLASADHLASGKKKFFEGKDVNKLLLAEEIDGLAKRLQELQHNSPRLKHNEARHLSQSSLPTRASTDRDDIDSRTKNNNEPVQEPMLHEENKCSGRCKAIVRKIAEQVRAETEQWSQMQEMLGRVRGEMEQLKASRDFWHNQAHIYDLEIQPLERAVQEWREKALNYEIKAEELQLEVSLLKDKLRKSKALELKMLRDNGHPDEKGLKLRKGKEELVDIEENEEDSPKPISLAKQLAKEKRILRLKEKRLCSEGASTRGVFGPRRAPLQDVGNSYGYSPESSRRRESFRK